MGSQLPRHRRLGVEDRRRCEEVVQEDRVEEDLAKNDVEAVVDEVLEVDVPQPSKTMSKRTMKLAKSMSMSEVVAKRGHQEDVDLVEGNDVKVVHKEMVMCRCGGVLSLDMGREDLGLTRALLPC